MDIRIDPIHLPHPAATKIVNATPTTSNAGQPKEITAINAIPATIPILTFTTGLRMSWPELNHDQGLAKTITPHGKSKSEAHILNSAAEPKDSQVSSQVPPDPPKPEPIPERTHMDPKIIISTNIIILPAIMRKPIICPVSPSDFAMMIFSRTYDTGAPPIVEGTTVFCELLARGVELCWRLLESSAKKTVFCVFPPNANANQTIEPKHNKTNSKYVPHIAIISPSSIVSPSSYFASP